MPKTRSTIRNIKYLASICFQKVLFGNISNTNRVVPSVPITNQNRDIPIRGWERNWNYIPVVNDKATKTTRRPLKINRREVKETPNLILNLELVSPIPLGRNRAICAENPILPRTSPLLNTGPAITIDFVNPIPTLPSQNYNLNLINIK